MRKFETINKAFNTTFVPDKLSIGIGMPIENNKMEPIATMKDHLNKAKLAEQLGFKAIWLRDIPFFVPSFGDAGQIFDPFTYLGYLASQTSEIALGIASIALPLHYPVHVAKAAASIDQLTGGRMLLGVASGDRPSEYPAMNINFKNRSNLFRESFDYIRKCGEAYPKIQTENYGTLSGDLDVVPKPFGKKIPLLVTSYSQQNLTWIADHADGWMNYPRSAQEQESIVKDWRGLVSKKYDYDKPYMQSFLIDLHPDDNFKPQPIHLGFRMGVNYLISYCEMMQEIGVNHIGLSLRFNNEEVIGTLKKISEKVLPHFN